MELMYRGRPYESISPEMEITETSQVGTFLGRPYRMHQTRVVQSSAGMALKYRGIRYNA